MNQTKIGYYADLVFYPILLAGFLLYSLDRGGIVLHGRWWLALLCGAMSWTLLEYLLHRFIYHEVPGIRELHGMHHERPTDYVGSPLWVSLLGFAFLFAVFASLGGIAIGCGLTAGLVLGYVSYLLVHDGTHRWHLAEGSWMRGYRLRHIRHHRSPVPGNFGVTTGFWDIVFGTEIAPERARAPEPVENAK